MSKSGTRRKPRLDEKRVKGIAVTFENEVGNAMFEIVGIGRDIENADEWMVNINPVSLTGGVTDGCNKLIMINDKTGKARYYAEYIAERNGRVGK